MHWLVYWHPSFLQHESGPGHPERPSRARAVMDGISASGESVEQREPTPSSVETLAAVHTPRYISELERFCLAGGGALDADTSAGPGSWEAAVRAAGAGLDAMAALREGAADAAFCVVRPPGHHARPGAAMGFCLFNNVAVATADAVAANERVAIVDWDVHHGNGTQEMFWDEEAVMYVSLHQAPFYPGTGGLDDTGGADTVVNLPMPAGSAGDVYRSAMDDLIVPLVNEFAPDWVMVSAGFDAHRDDPLAGQALEAGDYGAMASSLAAVTPAGRLIHFLEGGYDLSALTDSAAATLQGTAGQVFSPPKFQSPPGAWSVLERASAVHRSA